MDLKPLARWQAFKSSTVKSWVARVAVQCNTIRLIVLITNSFL